MSPSAKIRKGMMNRGARAYIGAIIAAGIATAMIALWKGAGFVAREPLQYLVIVAVMIATERFVIHFTFRNETISFSMIEVAMTYALLRLPAAPFVLSAALGVLGGQVLRRRPPLKAAFNASMYALGAAGAAAAFGLAESSAIHDAQRWLPAIAGMVVFYLANQVMVAKVVALVEARRMRDILAVGPIGISMTAGNVSLGLIGYYLATHEPRALWLMLVPFILSYAAYKAWVNGQAAARKMRDLYTAGAALVRALETEESFDGFLEAAKELFRASGAEIITFEGPRQMKILTTDGADMRDLSSVWVTEKDVQRELEIYIRSRNWRSYRLAALSSEMGLSGALIVSDHRGAEGLEEFPDQDQHLINLLADEVSIRMKNITLFKSVSEERAKLSDIVEHTTDGIYQVSPDRKIVSWNPAMEAITGYSAREAVGQMCFNLLRARDAAGVDMCSSDCPITAAGRECTHQNREAQIMTKQGAQRWISYSHSPILSDEGAMTADVVVVRDVTEQRAVRELKDDFVATVSHELRTPLTPIKGFLMTLLRAEARFTDEDRAEIYQRMLANTERLERLVEDLLAVSRLESGRLRLETGPTDVTQVVTHLVEEYRHTRPERNFRFTANQPECIAVANDARLEQVVSNLLENAIRYSPESQPVEIIVRSESSGVTIAVRDRGPGIPYDEQEKIFERFYRGGHHLTRESGGTGLGLFIARRLTEAMGGRLSLDSVLGQGSTFFIHLGPAGAAAAGPAGAATN